MANGTCRRSLLTGVVVGAILTSINQGDVLVAGEEPNLIKGRGELILCIR